ncbi:TonB-dependent receptor [Flammeovirga aprica]|uniref:TonB-dependent receptor n=1 Tax=Flammeovirga aprica JL-4 TaxID=694437 RepID=A0A7X9S096_9BACT|nr:TonB-dependent receptor [Flammeovirga aprica]NME71978.1 TonB-dependent receptor [Flammeovirga aprica JL-4]
MKHLTLIFLSILLSQFAFSQTYSLQGKVIDKVTQQPIIGASIQIENSNPVIGTTADADGKFRLQGIKMGRYTLLVQSMGYKNIRKTEVLVTGEGQNNVVLEMEESVTTLDDITISATTDKDASNIMSVVSNRSFSIEESGRFAGGMSDPSRVAYNFAGVTFSAPQDNGVVIRGNSPTSVLWRVNDIDVSGAAHFGGGNLAGAGLISIYSANVLRSTDFFTSAFPSEYSNTTSGVFDINFRKGDSEKHHHSVQLGILGADFASEGPINKEKGSSYLVNYRHGFIGYIGKLSGGTAPNFQDLSFNLSFPSKKYGNLTIWGMGGLSDIETPFKKYVHEVDDEDPTDIKLKYREYDNDFLDKDIDFGMGAIGVNHQIPVGNHSVLSTSLGATTNLYKNDTRYFQQDADTLNSGTLHPHERQQNIESKYSFANTLTTTISPKLINKSGIRADLITSNGYAQKVDTLMGTLQSRYNGNLQAYNLNAFTQFKYQVLHNFSVNAGVSVTKFELVDEVAVEPRLGMQYTPLKNVTLGVAYGRHSKREELKVYSFINPELQKVNDLKLSKSDHYVGSLKINLSSNVRLTTEVYYQELFDVPVMQGTAYSFANYTTLWEANAPIVNTGTGVNKGIDITLERSMVNGFYYMLSGSIYDSKYTDDLGVTRNTLFNRNFMATITAGKEFVVKGKNLLGVNINATYLGGTPLTPYDEKASHEQQKVVYKEGELYSIKGNPEVWMNFGVTYKIPKKKSVRTWGLDMQNALLTTQMRGYKYNHRLKTIDEDHVFFIMPNLYYKISF